MSSITIRQMAERVAGLMEVRLGVPGKDVATRLRRGARRLPRKLRKNAALLADAAEMAAHPKLVAQLDEARVAAAYDALTRYLSSLGGKTRRRDMLRDMTTSAVLSLLAAVGLFIIMLIWGGFI